MTKRNKTSTSTFRSKRIFNKTRCKKNKTCSGGGNSLNTNDYLFVNPNITTEPNRNPSAVPVGIIHVTESAGINAFRTMGTGFSNMLGSKGFDNTIYDKLRNSVLAKLADKMSENNIKKVCNVRIEVVSPAPALILANVYGTAYN